VTDRQVSTFGAWLKARRRELDLTQEGLAERAGCSVEMVRKVEAGTARPSRQLAELLAASVDVTPTEIPAYVRWARLGHPPDGPGGPGIPPGDARAPIDPPLRNPYKGLRAFEESDAEDFFGRESLTGRLLGRLGVGTQERSPAPQFLAVVGPSGSGKSSVVRAGLVPALRARGLPEFERSIVLDVVVGGHPLEEIEASLLRAAVNPPSSLMPQLLEDERGLLRAVKRVLPGPRVALLLVLDQFEELFTLVVDERLRAHVVESLWAAVTDPRSPLWIVATLRADVYDRPLQYPHSGELMRHRTEVVLPMLGEELERAIAEPAARVGVTLEQPLLAAIIRDVGEQPGTLPLLQFALTELFDRRDDHVMTLDAYRASGGVREALRRRAEGLFMRLAAGEREVARQLFLRLVALGDGAEDSRRRVSLSELTSATTDEEALHRVLDLFGRHRLLTFDRSRVTGGPTVEVGHEALIQSWTRLREWVDASRDAIRTQRRLSAAATEWLGAQRDVSFLASGSRLGSFEALAAPPDVEAAVTLSGDERAYLEASVAERGRAAQAEQARRARERVLEQRAAQRLRTLAGALAVFLVVAVALLAIALVLRQRAESSRTRSEALRLAAEARALLEGDGPTEAMALLSIRSVRVEHTVQGDEVLEAAASHPYPMRHFIGHDDAVYGVAMSPDGRLVLTGSWDATARLWDAATEHELHVLAGHEGPVQGVAFSADGKLAITGSFDATARIWSVSTGGLVRILSGHEDVVVGVAFSPDGSLAVTGSGDGTARLWDATDGAELRRLVGHEGKVLNVAMSPDGRSVLTGSEDGTARLWDARTGDVKRVIRVASGPVWGVAFSPDGGSVLTGSDDRVARLWDPGTGREIQRFEGHSDVVNSVAVSPDGLTILTGSNDNTVRLYDIGSGELIATVGTHTAPVIYAAFSPDGRAILTGGLDRSAFLWDASPEPFLPTYAGHDGDVIDAAFSPDGRLVATASDDMSARIWNADSGVPVATLAGHASPQFSLAFSPGGSTLATTGGPANTARIWDLPTGVERLLLRGHSGVVTDIAYSPDGRQVITSSIDGSARLWDASTGRAIRAFSDHGEVFAAAFSPDGTAVLTGGLDGTAVLWDAGTGSPLVTLVGHDGPVNAVAFSSDGRHVATVGEDRSARLWDPRTGRELRRFSGHVAPIGHVAFSPDGRSLLTASLDRTARVWGITTGDEIRRLPHAASAAFSPDGRLIVGATDGGAARLWYTDHRTVLTGLCRRLTRDLTDQERTQFGVDDGEATCPP
jgi:WD40 repeat protein/transcriptional regulator with XRE-family HTH domain